MSQKQNTVKPRALHRLDEVRGPAIERARQADKSFPPPGHSDTELTDDPGDFVHPANREAPRGKAQRILPD